MKGVSDRVEAVRGRRQGGWVWHLWMGGGRFTSEGSGDGAGTVLEAL